MKPQLSKADKLCLVAIAVCFLTPHLVFWAIDEAAVRSTEDKPLVEITWEAPLEEPQLLEAITAQLKNDHYREDVPLDRELQTVLWEACEEHSVPVSLALGLIEEESHFQTDIVSGKGAYGLCQLNPKYFPANLTPAENIDAGIGYLGELLTRYGDTAAALRAYNLGYDDGDRVFADVVLASAAKWE